MTNDKRLVYAVTDVIVWDMKSIQPPGFESYTGLSNGKVTNPYNPNIEGERVIGVDVCSGIGGHDVAIYVKFEYVDLNSDTLVLTNIAVTHWGCDPWGPPITPDGYPCPYDGWNSANGQISGIKGALNPGTKGPCWCNGLVVQYKKISEVTKFVTNFYLSRTENKGPIYPPFANANGGTWPMQSSPLDIHRGCGDDWSYYVCFALEDKTPEPPIPCNLEMNDVEGAFRRVSSKGSRVFYESYHNYPTSSAGLYKSHFKGIACYKNKLIFTHTNLAPLIDDKNPGKIIIADKQTSGDQANISAVYDTTLYHPGWSHPCSAQACGGFMAMGIQANEDSNCAAEIHILNLTPLDNDAQPVSIGTIACVNKSGGKSQLSAVNGVAMTKEHGEDGKYIIAGLQGHALTIYKSVNSVLNPSITDNQFYVVGETIQNFERSGAGIALITQTDGRIYIIALDTDDNEGKNNSIYLYQLTITDSSVTCSAVAIASKKMPVPGLSEAVRYATSSYILPLIISQDAVCGAFLGAFPNDILNTSFRWGKGLAIISPDEIEVYSTDRNDLTTSKFSWPVDTKKDFSFVTWSSD